MFDTFKNRLELTGTLSTITALRIGQGRSLDPTESDLPVSKDAFGQPLIPGASFKGALRSRLESFLRGVLGCDRSQVTNPAVDSEWSITREEMTQLKTTYTSDLDFTNAVLAQTDRLSKLMGAPWLASKFQVRDLTVKPDTWFDQYQDRNGVSIDRDTEIAADKKLYQFQVVPAGTEFTFQAVVENVEDSELGLLMIGLHQFETQQIPLGGGRSRGLGVVELRLDTLRWINPANPQELLDYLQASVAGELESYDCTKQINDLKTQWTSALIAELRQKLTPTQPSAT